MSNDQTKNQDATGIPTWLDRATEANPGTNPQNWTARMKTKHMLDEIADLRAQLARQEQKAVATLAEHCESGDLIIWHGPKPPEGSKLYLAAPASAQPAIEREWNQLMDALGCDDTESALKKIADLSAQQANPMCERKTNDIMQREGYQKTGYVLKKDGERICVSDGGAVAWFTPEQWNWLMFNRDHVEFQWPKPLSAQLDRGAAPEATVINYGNAVDKSTSLSQPVRGVPDGWKRATDEQKAIGWEWECQWIVSLQSAVMGQGWDVSMEAIDALLTLLAPFPAAQQYWTQEQLDRIDESADAMLKKMKAPRMLDDPAAQPVAPAAPTYWNSQQKMISRAIIGLRDGWATRKDADDALAVLEAVAPAQGAQVGGQPMCEGCDDLAMPLPGGGFGLCQACIDFGKDEQPQSTATEGANQKGNIK